MVGQEVVGELFHGSVHDVSGKRGEGVSDVGDDRGVRSHHRQSRMSEDGAFPGRSGFSLGDRSPPSGKERCDGVRSGRAVVGGFEMCSNRAVQAGGGVVFSRGEEPQSLQPTPCWGPRVLVLGHGEAVELGPGDRLQPRPRDLVRRQPRRRPQYETLHLVQGAELGGQHHRQQALLMMQGFPHAAVDTPVGQPKPLGAQPRQVRRGRHVRVDAQVHGDLLHRQREPTQQSHDLAGRVLLSAGDEIRDQTIGVARRLMPADQLQSVVGCQHIHRHKGQTPLVGQPVSPQPGGRHHPHDVPGRQPPHLLRRQQAGVVDVVKDE